MIERLFIHSSYFFVSQPDAGVQISWINIMVNGNYYFMYGMPNYRFFAISIYGSRHDNPTKMCGLSNKLSDIIYN